MTQTFLGLPVEGDKIGSSREQVEQRPAEELAPFIEAVLGVDGVVGVRWRQYTPYFNDGEPCEFGLGEPYVATETSLATEDGDYGDGWLSDLVPGSYDPVTRRLIYGDVAPEHAALVEPWDALTAAYGARYEESLREKFGDHATVTVYRDRITIEEYEHD